MQVIFAFLRQYIAYYASAGLGGFSALWLQSEGAFSTGTLGYLAAVIFMPAVVKALQGGESFAQKWAIISGWIDKFQEDQLNPGIDLAQTQGAQIAENLDELISQKVKQAVQDHLTMQARGVRPDVPSEFIVTEKGAQ